MPRICWLLPKCLSLQWFRHHGGAPTPQHRAHAVARSVYFITCKDAALITRVPIINCISHLCACEEQLLGQTKFKLPWLSNDRKKRCWMSRSYLRNDKTTSSVCYHESNHIYYRWNQIAIYILSLSLKPKWSQDSVLHAEVAQCTYSKLAWVTILKVSISWY